MRFLFVVFFLRREKRIFVDRARRKTVDPSEGTTIMSATPRQIGRAATTDSLDLDGQNVRVEDKRRAPRPSLPTDNWQPGDGYGPHAEHLQAAMDVALANEPEASQAEGGKKMLAPASGSFRQYGKANVGSRASIIAATAPQVANYLPPPLRSSLHS